MKSEYSLADLKQVIEKLKNEVITHENYGPSYEFIMGRNSLAESNAQQKTETANRLILEIKDLEDESDLEALKETSPRLRNLDSLKSQLIKVLSELGTDRVFQTQMLYTQALKHKAVLDGVKALNISSELFKNFKEYMTEQYGSINSRNREILDFFKEMMNGKMRYLEERDQKTFVLLTEALRSLAKSLEKFNPGVIQAMEEKINEISAERKYQLRTQIEPTEKHSKYAAETKPSETLRTIETIENKPKELIPLPLEENTEQKKSQLTDLQKKVLEEIDSGTESKEEIRKKLNISNVTIHALVAQLKSRGFVDENWGQ
ncbi:MAG: hypothetical protein ACTSUW_05405 [Candidatus Heimdallarchaeota archaeon]